jgi:hypothetical protein
MEKKEGLLVNVRISEKANKNIEKKQAELRLQGFKKTKMQVLTLILEEYGNV